MDSIPFSQVGVGNRGAHVLQEVLTHHGAFFQAVAWLMSTQTF